MVSYQYLDSFFNNLYIATTAAIFFFEVSIYTMKIQYLIFKNPDVPPKTYFQCHPGRI